MRELSKILTITYNDLSIPWGPAVHYLELWNNIAKEYPDVLVEGIAPSWERGRSFIIHPVFHIKRIKVPNIKLLRQVIYDLAVALMILVKCKRYDLVYIRLSYFHLFSYLVLKVLKLNYTLELNGIVKEDTLRAKRSGLYRFFSVLSERVMIKNSKACIAVSEGIRDFAVSLGCRNVKVVYNGVSEELFSITKQSNVLRKAVYVGTFTPWDGHSRVFELARKFPEIEFWIVGGGEKLDFFKEKYKMVKNLRFLGYISYKNLKSVYSEVEAGIALYERGFRNNMKLSSLKTLEYVASGLPVFSTNVPGQEYLFENGVGVEATEKLEECFQNFIDNFPYLKENVDRYRERIKNVVSWRAKAVEEFEFIRKVVECQYLKESYV